MGCGASKRSLNGVTNGNGHNVKSNGNIGLDTVVPNGYPVEIEVRTSTVSELPGVRTSTASNAWTSASSVATLHLPSSRHSGRGRVPSKSSSGSSRSKFDEMLDHVMEFPTYDPDEKSPAQVRGGRRADTNLSCYSTVESAKKNLEESGQTDINRVAMTLTKDPHLLILFVGGTIGMSLSAEGYAPVEGYLPQRMTELPMLQDPMKPPGTMPKSIYGRHTTYDVKEYDPLLDSSSMSQKDWIKIAEDIKENYDQYDGFVVLHGTDTMAYTASALSFMLENLTKPVVVTGSQIPISELRNDAVENVLGAMLVAGHFQIPEVMVVFRSHVLRGNRTWKESSHSLEGFRSPNLGPLATIGVQIEVDWDTVLPMPVDPLIVHNKLVSEIAVITLFPGISPVLVRTQLAPPVKGAVLQTYGAGNAPEFDDLLEVLREASKRGVLLVNVTQCRHGGVAAGAYAAGAGLVRARVVAIGDITLEAALAKMSVVLGRGLTGEHARLAMTRNFSGEIEDKGDEKVLSLSSTAFIRAVGKALGTFGQESRAQIQKALLPVMACSAASEGDVTELAGIFRVGESPDCRDCDSRAPLHIAAAEGYLDCVSFLIEKQANVNVEDRWGGRPLDDACLNSHTEVCNLLIHHGGTLSQSCSERLFHAVRNSNLEQVRLMIKCKVDVNHVDYAQRSVLMLGARISLPLVRLLLDARADPCKKDAWGHTALGDAKDSNIKTVLEEEIKRH